MHNMDLMLLAQWKNVLYIISRSYPINAQFGSHNPSAVFWNEEVWGCKKIEQGVCSFLIEKDRKTPPQVGLNHHIERFW